jgi:catechol 2,3-dioxygenase-like lactoylglutathione lyase family enzyme
MPDALTANPAVPNPSLPDPPLQDWFARPVLHVKDVEASLRFYLDKLGFSSPWRYDEQGIARVAQVERQGCSLILANNLTPDPAGQDRTGHATIFISINVEPPTPAASAARLDALRAELESRSVLVKDGSWGYRLLVVDDPDGNQLLFNYA